MGSGKSYWGVQLAAHRDVPLIDLDRHIEAQEQQTIAQLFAERGESGFRALEQRYLHTLADLPASVVSLGGGTPCFFDNMDYMNGHGQTVFLDVHPDILFNRLRVATHQRPILQGKTDEELRAFIADALEKRAPFYVQARYRFDAGHLESRRQIAGSVQQLRSLLGI